MNLLINILKYGNKMLLQLLKAFIALVLPADKKMALRALMAFYCRKLTKQSEQVLSYVATRSPKNCW
jgi:hypothetical protein